MLADKAGKYDTAEALLRGVIERQPTTTTPTTRWATRWPSAASAWTKPRP
jgi:hypothetical protein